MVGELRSCKLCGAAKIKKNLRRKENVTKLQTFSEDSGNPSEIAFFFKKETPHMFIYIISHIFIFKIVGIGPEDLYCYLSC